MDERQSIQYNASSGVSDEVRDKANKYFHKKILFNAVLVLIGAVFIAAFLRQMQHQIALSKMQESSKLSLTETVEVLKSNEAEADELTGIFHEGNQDMLEDLNELISSGIFDSFAEADSEERSAVIEDIIQRSGVDYLFALNNKGKVALAPLAEWYGMDPVAEGLISEENIKLLLRGTQKSDGSVTPAHERNEYGEYYFYSLSISFAGKKYTFVLGADASVLNSQIESLRDLSAVLGHAVIENDGFMIAVDRERGSLVYYRNGGVNLAGHRADSIGLSSAALNDGYAGFETIRGNEYYCVSKGYGSRYLICTATPVENIYDKDKHVVIWTTIGFLTVMLLCLAYSIIVRNDFVRNSVETRKKVFRADSSNPVIFDISIFNKVMPLMIAGILVVFGISFYSQTLLEISQGIDKSVTILDDATVRYQEENDVRTVVNDYYSDRFLAKAGLISYILEEDPSVLNEKSDHYHSYYDEKGSKIFAVDDEGNRLRSVPEAVRLRELCNINNLNAIYVFDDEGRTIATNTANWHFAISHNEEDQSYAFWDVLDGKADSLAQKPMESDEGDIGQFIGVGFNYYTRRNDNGRTEYVSRREYENNPEGISRHHSMVQIGLGKEMAERLLGTTAAASVLSGSMVSSGIITLFDNSEDHLCVYSPKETSIGKTAEEMGISRNAFSGDDYYGFRRINGTNYFQYVRYADGYFISNAIPKDVMYNYRTYVALMTSLVSLMILLILLGTVTFTTKEEELLYLSMSDAKIRDGMDASIFSIILPSGRRASTTKAAARWDNRSIPWHTRTPEQKLVFMLSICFGLFMLYILLMMIRANAIFDEGSIVRYILSGRWDRGLNLFAMTACVLVLITTSIIISLFRIPVRLITALLGTRGETVGHLLLSVMKYGGVIGAFFYGLYLLGIDSRNLLASAGILSLVLGFGAQSLIKDIIAGIFIVFEGEFRVGDIVTIAGYRGTVMDIGIRTTKILGIDGNIKIFNNSEITGVLNMTQETSLALTYISIEYGQDIDYVEAVLDRELPGIRENNRDIISGPKYYGVTDLGDSGVVLLIGAECQEKDILSVKRELNKGVLQIFYRNHINVPFPNVTFSQLDVDGRRTIEDLIQEDLRSKQNRDLEESDTGRKSE